MTKLNLNSVLSLFQFFISIVSSQRFFKTNSQIGLCTDNIQISADNNQCADQCAYTPGCWEYFHQNSKDCYICFAYYSAQCTNCIPNAQHYVSSECMASRTEIVKAFSNIRVQLRNAPQLNVHKKFSTYVDGYVGIHWKGIKPYNSQLWHMATCEEKVGRKKQKMGIGEYTTTIAFADKGLLKFLFLGENTRYINYQGDLTHTEVTVLCGNDKLQINSNSRFRTVFNLTVTTNLICPITKLDSIGRGTCTFVNYCKYFNMEKKTIYDFSFLRDNYYEIEHDYMRYRFSICKPVECLDHRFSLICALDNVHVIPLAYMGSGKLEMDSTSTYIQFLAGNKRTKLRLKCNADTQGSFHFISIDTFEFRSTKACHNVYQEPNS